MKRLSVISLTAICAITLMISSSWTTTLGKNISTISPNAAAVVLPWAPDGSIELSDKVVVGVNQDGRLEIFFRNSVGLVYHMWQSNGGWLGGTLNGGVIKGDPAVINNQDGRLEVFGRGGDDAIWHICQTAPNGGWGGWATLGCGLSCAASDPAVGRDGAGRLEVFYIGSDSYVYHNAQTTANGAAGWAGFWDSQRGCCVVGNPAVGSNADGRLELFARGFDSTIYHQWETDPSGNNWNGVWFALPGVAFAGNIVVANNADGRLEIFDRSVNNCIFHAWQNQAGWSDWAILCAPVLGDPAVVATADNRLGAFMHADVTHFILQASQNAPNGGWNGCAPLGDGRIASTPAAGRNIDGRLELFIYQYENGIPALRHSSQFWANGPWSNWADM